MESGREKKVLSTNRLASDKSFCGRALAGPAEVDQVRLGRLFRKDSCPRSLHPLFPFHFSSASFLSSGINDSLWLSVLRRVSVLNVRFFSWVVFLQLLLVLSVSEAQFKTLTLDSGVQVSGVLDSTIVDSGQVVFIKFSGPTQVSLNHQQLKQQGPSYHSMGYSSPIGLLADGTDLSSMSSSQLRRRGLVVGQAVHLVFQSGIELTGTLTAQTDAVSDQGLRPLLFTFKNCRVFKGERVFFEPEWGPFDLVLGTKLSDVRNGLADPEGFEEDLLKDGLRCRNQFQ